MASFYLAPALRTLRAEVDRAHPKRDRRSDGWVGDTSHNARRSDHNPDYGDGGVVRALDIDKDGVDMAKLLHVAVRSNSVNYVIWNGHIYSRAHGFRKRVYTGANKHTNHMHISLRHGKTYEDSSKRWGYVASAPTPTPNKPQPKPDNSGGDLVFPTLKLGSKGQQVRNLQGLLFAAGRTITIDGNYGPATERQVRNYQKAAGLKVDGIAGTTTFRTLLGV